ncbi:putative nuclease HARBI1 [Rhagoletis pomonella]|uniref:putative nuclease HARBI1 n=1 Tax=Rhagoletis pomonella TaxID=28610 RepID=UPI0017849A14|nr:putative nuclease HARBI1 [Rhagoletis pomonella]
MEEEFLLLLIAKWHDAFNSNRMKRLRDHTDPFDLPQDFTKQFLLPKSMCRSLIEDLLPFDDQGTTLPLALRFLAALNFYATGIFQNRMAGNVLDISQPTVSRALSSITELLVKHKGDEISFPNNEEQQLVVKKGFKEKCGLDNIVGTIGTAHINILMPTEKNGASVYVNELGECTIKVEGICDYRLLFTSLNARGPGSVSTSTIWRNSPTRQFLMSHNNEYSTNALLIGDIKYPLEPWLLTPVVRAKNRKDIVYNEKHRSAHNSIKLAFGLLRTRFKCLSKKRKLYYAHERAANIIYACAILHNMLLKNGGGTEVDKIELDTLVEETTANVKDRAAMKNEPKFVDGTHVRNRIIRT